jgi:hypothetical protein
MADRYLGNKKKKEYHDLYKRTTACQIDEIKERVYFSTEEEAERAGYDRCAHCLGRSKR